MQPVSHVPMSYARSNHLQGIDDDIARRDNLHAAINNLPDPNYATLRALTLVCSMPFTSNPSSSCYEALADNYPALASRSGAFA